MRWTRWTSFLSCLVAVVGTAITFSCTTQTPQTSSTAPGDTLSQLKVGERLAHTSGCNDCHTPGGMYGAPDFARTLSGSELGWQGPWGVSYPRNLTPDPATGIGSWSAQDIVNAIRTGHRPDGSVILPPMPWQAYSHMTDQDANAIAAYLKSLPPIQHKVPDKIPPGAPVTGAVLVFPPPPAWDAPRTAAPSDTG
jgi:mono/diheme cytochrome c family protein